jgi:toxin-antitoxin system PIN domain toxin
MSYLLDANALIAWCTPEHIHHGSVMEWMGTAASRYATCPITQGALVRFMLRALVPGVEALDLIEGIMSDPHHEFWEDSLPFTAVDMRGVIGHRQATDAYLAQLARAHNAKLVTFDKGLVAQHPDVTWLLKVA